MTESETTNTPCCSVAWAAAGWVVDAVVDVIVAAYEFCAVASMYLTGCAVVDVDVAIDEVRDLVEAMSFTLPPVLELQLETRKQFQENDGPPPIFQRMAGWSIALLPLGIWLRLNGS